MATNTSASVLEPVDHVPDIGNMVVLPMINNIGDDIVSVNNERFCLYNFTNQNHEEKSFTYKKGQILIDVTISYGVLIEFTEQERNFVLKHFNHA